MRSFEQQEKSNNASSLTIHPQLEVGGKDDPQEKEANAMADKVMRMSDGDTVRPKMGDEEEGKVRKMGDEEEGKVMKMGDDEEKKVMKMGDDDEKKVMKMGDEEDGKVMKMDAGGGGGMAAPANVASGIQNTKGGGQNLPQNVQQDLGGKMGADFSDVKVHTDDHANDMSESINAKAFTHGKDIYFRQGNYSPESGDGKKLLAHELTHTMQQGAVVQPKVQRSFWGDMWGGVKKVGNFLYEESGAKSIVDTGRDIYHWAADSPEQFQKYMQGKLKGQMEELRAAKTPTPKFYAAYYMMKGVAMAMNPLGIFMMPSAQSLWDIYVQGKLGYYTHLYHLGDQKIEKQNATTGKKEMVANPDYKKGGYAAVFANQMRNMIDPRFVWGEVKGIFKGIGNWFVDLWDMIKFLGKMIWGGISDTWNMLVHNQPPPWMVKTASFAISSGKWLNEHGKGIVDELGKLMQDKDRLHQVVGDLKGAIKTGAGNMAWAAGEGVASQQVKVMNMSANDQGEMFGKVIGYLIPEIIIAVFSETIVNWIKGGVKAIQVFWETVRATRVISKALEGARWVVEGFEKIGAVLRKIGGKIGKAFDDVMEFFKGLFKWGEEAPKKIPADEHLPGGPKSEHGTSSFKDERITEQTTPETSQPKNKTKGTPEDQLSDKAKNYPSPLTSNEMSKVNGWQNTRNQYLKKWREKDLSEYSDKVRELLTKKPNPDNSIRNSMTPDDLAAILKENRGVQIFDETGKVYNHMQEAQGAMQSIIKKIKEIEKMLGEVQKLKLTQNDVLVLQEKLSDLSILKQNYSTLIR